jgi:hypothetical protein
MQCALQRDLFKLASRERMNFAKVHKAKFVILRCRNGRKKFRPFRLWLCTRWKRKSSPPRSCPSSHRAAKDDRRAEGGGGGGGGGAGGIASQPYASGQADRIFKSKVDHANVTFLINSTSCVFIRQYIPIHNNSHPAS